MMDRCPKCKEFTYEWRPHHCQLFMVLDRQRAGKEIEDCDWVEIGAVDAEVAAAKYCERDDRQSADYTYIRNEGAEEIWVKDADGVIRRFSVNAYTENVYTATPLGAPRGG